MIPWIIMAFAAVALIGVGLAARRKTVAGEHAVGEDAGEKARIEQEFAEAEAYEAKWREEDKERFRQERLP